MRQRSVPVVALLAALGAGLAVPGTAHATEPVTRHALAAEDDGARRWAVRPAGKDGQPDARTHFTLQSTPGGTVSERALVTNLSAVPVTYSVYGTDAVNTPQGAFDLLGSDQKPQDLGSWIVLKQHAVTIGAGRTVAVPFTVGVPAIATPGDHAGALVVSLKTKGSGPNKVDVESRIAVRVYLRIPGDLRPLLSVNTVAASYQPGAGPLGRGRIDVDYTVRNPGNIRLRGRPTVVVKNALGKVVATLTPADLPELLPRGSATFTVSAARVFPAGPLSVSVSLAAYPDPEQPVGQAVPPAAASGYVWAISWSLVLLVVGFLAAVTALLWWRRRRALKRLDRALGAGAGAPYPAMAGGTA